jgi:hypothetical protein
MASPSEIFKKIMDSAQSSSFDHHGIRDDERAAALGDFLRKRLPDVFAITKGEVVDSFDNRESSM